MQVDVDGVIFQMQARGGISRIFRTVLPLMCDLDPQLAISLYMARPGRDIGAVHPQIQPKRLLPLDSRVFAWTGLSTQTRRSIAISLGVRADKNTIWHSTYYSQPQYWAGPQLLSVHDLIYFLFQDLFSGPHNDRQRQQMERAIRTADQILCISATTAQDVIDYFGIAPHKIHVATLAAGPTFRPLSQTPDAGIPTGMIPTARPYLLYIGPRYHYKNFSTLLEAYARWPHRGQVDLVVVGPTWTEAEAATIQAHNVSSNLHVCTGISDEALNRLYNQATAFVYPSLYEGFGIPLLEAMAVGCPIVASDIPSSREIAGDYPVYFNATDVDALIGALDTVWLNPQDESHVRAGQRAAAQYSWEQTARKTLERYYALVGMALPPHLQASALASPDLVEPA